MRRQGRRDTKPELELRRTLHRMGFRYYVDRTVLAGTRRRHDLVFPGAKVLVEVRGCYWHACPQHGTSPKANAGWWAQKLAANVERDRDTERRAAAEGWELIVVWEHDDPQQAAVTVATAVRARQAAQ
jgi:DNA mismatch endonuclease (patch repair protein)